MLHSVFALYFVATNAQRCTDIECNIGIMLSNNVSQMLETYVEQILIQQNLIYVASKCFLSIGLQLTFNVVPRVNEAFA